MGSKDREIRVKQMEKAVAGFEARKKALEEKGLDEKAVAKDTVLRSLRADMKKARLRVVAIDKIAAHVAEVAEKDTKVKKEEGGKKAKEASAKGGKAKKPGKGGNEGGN